MDISSQEIVAQALKLGFDDVIADGYVVSNLQLRFSNNEVDIVNRWREYGTTVFLALGKRIMTTEIHDPSKAGQVLETTLRVLKSTRENPDYRGIYEGPFRYGTPMVDPKLREFDGAAGYVDEAIAAAERAGATSTAGTLMRRLESHDLNTSQGAQARDERASVELSLRAFSEREASGHAIAAATRLSDFAPAEAGRKAGEIATLAKGPRAGEEGRYDAVLDPLIFGSLIDAFTSMASAMVVMAGLSMLQDKVGQKVASPEVTLADDPTQAAGMGHRLFDDEGVPGRRVPLVESGVLTGYLHNTSTASKFGVEPTGSASLRAPVGFLGPMPSNVTLQPGDYGREELFSEVKEGLYLTNTWYTRYQNRVKGDFSTIPRDGIFRIKDGEIVGSWKDIRVTENLLDLFKRIDGLTEERHQVHWWAEVSVPTFAPYALVRGVNLTRAKE